ncbi:hypothetical protein SLS62_008794 [Diatrype stigma]|uniref:Uncharacterized protein n=1 Tax=Diatrype stigma TaxID=117547 RepID=A0AAN9UK21_9PEZI
MTTPGSTLGDIEGFQYVAVTVASRSKLETLQNDGLSDLLPWSAFIFSVCAIWIVGTCYLSERVLFDAVYRDTYRKLVDVARVDGHDRRRRSFVYHHVAFAFKMLLLCVLAYPTLRLICPGPAGFHTPLGTGVRMGVGVGEAEHRPTIGDILLVGSQLYCAYYTWELCYRAGLASYISILHHVVLLIIAQLGMALSARPEAHRDATIEFYMCLIWGVFDLVAELPVHLALILYRALPESRCRMVSQLLFFCSGWCLCCTVAEMSISAYLLRRSWGLWEPSFQVATPVVLVVWGTAQCIGSWQIFGLAMVGWRKVAKRGL